MYQINALNPKEEGHQARKRFGQNFLHDQRVIAKIVRSVNPRAGENIVEIGPGLAALTSPLIGECDALTVIELDRDFFVHLPRFLVVVADAVPDVPIDVHVRKQGKILKHIADPTLAGRNEYFAGRIEEHFAVVDDPAAIRLQ